MVPIIYDHRQHKVYMMNTTTHKFYSHLDRKQFKPANTLKFTVIGGALYRMQQRWASQLYLNNPSQAFKTSFVIIGILVGILLFWCLLKKRHQPLFREYMKKKPSPKEVTDTGEIKKSWVRRENKYYWQYLLMLLY